MHVQNLWLLLLNVTMTMHMLLSAFTFFIIYVENTVRAEESDVTTTTEYDYESDEDLLLEDNTIEDCEDDPDWLPDVLEKDVTYDDYEQVKQAM